jgi:hypothetical protein
MHDTDRIANILQAELTEHDRKILIEDTERSKRLGAGQHLDDHLAFIPGLQIRRRLAMRLAHSNAPIGGRYAEEFSDLMQHGSIVHMNSTSVTALLWLGDDPKRLALLKEIRDGMTPGQRSRLNSPISAKQRVQNALKERTASAGGVEKKESPLAACRAALAARDREIAALKARLERESASLFDLKLDTAANIAATIVGNTSSHRAKAIADDIRAKLKQGVKPAG